MLKNVKIFLDKIGFSIIIAFKVNMMIAETLMTIDDLAEYLKVTKRTIYEWLKEKKIPAMKLVGQWRFKKEKIDAWLESQAMQESTY